MNAPKVLVLFLGFGILAHPSASLLQDVEIFRLLVIEELEAGGERECMVCVSQLCQHFPDCDKNHPRLKYTNQQRCPFRANCSSFCDLRPQDCAQSEKYDEKHQVYEDCPDACKKNPPPCPPWSKEPTKEESDKCPTPKASTAWETEALKQIRIDEGLRFHVYRDCVVQEDKSFKSLKTLGIGHYAQNDPKWSKVPYGTPVSCEVVMDFFKEDVSAAAAKARRAIPDFDDHPDEVKEVMTNVAFQLGGYHKFPNMLKAVKAKDYEKAALEMMWDDSVKKTKESLWFSQSENRVKRHMEKLRAAQAKISKPSAM